MTLCETIAHLVIGGAIGFILGYITRFLQEIKEELDEVDKNVKDQQPRDEKGFMRFPIAADIAVVITVALCVFAAFSTEITNNKLTDATSDLRSTQTQLKKTQADLKDAQEAIERLSTCNQKFIVQINKTLNARTIYTQERADTNVELQKAQSEFLRVILIEPPVTEEQARAALKEYFTLVNKFVDASIDAKKNAEIFLFPTDEEVSACYSDADEETQEKKDAAE